MNAEQRQALREIGIDEKEIERLDEMLTDGAKPDLVMMTLAALFFVACVIGCLTIGAR